MEYTDVPGDVLAGYAPEEVELAGANEDAGGAEEDGAGVDEAGAVELERALDETTEELEDAVDDAKVKDTEEDGGTTAALDDCEAAEDLRGPASATLHDPVAH